MDETPGSIAGIAGPGEGQGERLVISESEHPIREAQLDLEALKVLYRLRDAGFKGYLVGGGVRDLYLGKQPKDFDISTDARPGQLRKLFRNSRTIGRRFRLVQVFFRGNKIIEVSTLRSQSEFDLNGPEQVLPHNNTFGTLEEDAFRRDLTINSLFYEIESNTIIDYTGGVNDLNQGIVRVVGDPDRRFTRDPVRMMRAVRHAARTGFLLDPQTLEAIKKHAEKLSLCPPSRLRDEILKDLQSGASLPWAELCLQTTLWETLFPMYLPYLQDPSSREQVWGELQRLLQVLDRLQGARKEGKAVQIPEFMLLAVLLLPWALRHFKLFETQVRGQAYQQLAKKIRAELDLHIGEQFNIKRMAKDSLATLLINLPTFHALGKEQNLPKWLRRKSYFRDCSRFYGLYRESLGSFEVKAESFQQEQAGGPAPELLPEKSVKSKGNGSGRRGGMNPAFSSSKEGVFGLRSS
ncbi:polynucleotide adenylyltransferase PcnB [Desulfogranum mediterraneum]|uniref:polynucleotide adenylyltransferase PcnB n=1 Tax=Desulfogranum mediterraneum TaxID=160661 RepID=UPI001E3A7306|nr:polynucleotide adenylyltransferase PcnB [Desulfogranum mediterraneum]